MKKSLVIAACIVALAACGGSSSTGGGGGGGSSAVPTSGQVLYTVFQSAYWMVLSAFTFVSQQGNVACTGDQTNFTCTIWDSQGSATSADHKCDVAGSWTTGSIRMDVTYACFQYIADEISGVTVDGNWTAQIFVSSQFQFDASAMTVAQADTTKQTAGECDYAQEVGSACGSTFSQEGGTCTIECNATALCDDTTALMAADWTATSDVTVTDPTCAVTTVIASGSQSDTLLCSATDTEASMSFILNGTFNGQSLNDTVNMTCTGVL